MGIPGRPMDDALAILYLLGSPDKVEILGICSNYGNGTAAETYESNVKMLEETGFTNIPVLAGNDKREDPVSESSRFIVDTVNKYPGEITYLGIGSLGNLYGAYLLDKTVFDKLKDLVLMGGITEPLLIHDNQPLDELNFSVNSVASACVLKNAHDITVITGNNCLPVAAIPKDEFLDKLCYAENPAGIYIAQKCGYRFKVKELVYGADSSYNWDGVAAAYLTDPDVFEDHPTPCRITEKDIASSGYLSPCSPEESNCVLNLPTAISRVRMQDLFYEGWLRLDVSDGDNGYSCKGLYLDKLIQPSILIELSHEPAHGFLLLQRLKESGLVEPGLDPSGFYRMLKRMEQEDYITSSEETDSSGKSRKVYRITDFGRRALLIWSDALENYTTHIERIIKEIRELD